MPSYAISFYTVIFISKRILTGGDSASLDNVSFRWCEVAQQVLISIYFYAVGQSKDPESIELTGELHRSCWPGDVGQNIWAWGKRACWFIAIKNENNSPITYINTITIFYLEFISGME